MKLHQTQKPLTGQALCAPFLFADMRLLSSGDDNGRCLVAFKENFRTRSAVVVCASLFFFCSAK